MTTSKSNRVRVVLRLVMIVFVAASALVLERIWARQTDLLSKALPTAAGQRVPEKIRPYLTPIDYSAISDSQCELESTSSVWDVAISGEGYFSVQLPSKMGGGIGYTRNGKMHRDPTGRLVIAIGNGLKLLPAISIPMGGCNLQISQDGVVKYNGEKGLVTAGQIRLARFQSPKKLQPVGDGVFCRTDFSGEPVICNPGSNDAGQLAQGFLEALPGLSKEAPTGPPLIQGPLESTSGKLDVAIQGDGFLKVQIESTIADGFAYTRKGKLKLNRLGQLAVAIGDGDGYRLQPPIALLAGATNITIEADGTVSYNPANSKLTAIAGQIQLSQFMTPWELREVHPGMYAESPGSGRAYVGNPGSHGAGLIFQGYLCSDEYAVPRKVCLLTEAQAKRMHAEFGDLLQ